MEMLRDAADPTRAAISGMTSFLPSPGKAVAHRFAKSCVRSSQEAVFYWRDVGTVDAYCANIDRHHP